MKREIAEVGKTSKRKVVYKAMMESFIYKVFGRNSDLDAHPEEAEDFDEYLENLMCCSLRSIGKLIRKDFFTDEPADEIIFIDDYTGKVVKRIKRFDPLQFLLGGDACD